jgi:predicted nuclease of predicted toxin-antitoxin system
MKFIADINISPQTVKRLVEKGYKIKRITEFLKPNAKDEEILDLALREKSTIITQDLDFSALLAKRGVNKPSVIVLRVNIAKPIRITEMLEKALPKIKSELSKGSIVIVEEERVRIRKLPIEI